MTLFLDTESKMMYFTAKDTSLIARKMEVYDSVIPSSNSVMATNIYVLGHYYRNNEWIKDAEQMTKNMHSNLEQYAPGFSNWAMLMSHIIYGFEEFCVIGKNAKNYKKEFISEYQPQRLLCLAEKTKIPMANYKGSKEQTLLYKCHNGVCVEPIELR